MDFTVDNKRAVEVSPPTRQELQVLLEACGPQCLILKKENNHGQN